MRVVIIGNGIAGITAARHIRKQSDAEIFVISGESRYFFSRTALMYVYMGHMKFAHTQPYENWFWRKNKINLIEDWVDFIDPEDKLVALQTGDVINYDKLILATGSRPRQLDIPGNNLPGVQSLYSRQDLELMEENTKNIKSAVVIGGGLIGVEMAEMLHSRDIETTMIIREAGFWDVVLPNEESRMVTNHLLSRGIKLKTEATLGQISGTSRVEQISLSTNEIMPTEFVGITIGVQPNISLVNKTGIETGNGILVDEHLETSIPDIFAIGDCAELRTPDPGRRAIEPVWYTGRKMGETVASTVLGKPEKYTPGLWFNSAKFFDLEYQIYGYVPNKPDKDSKQYYWQDIKKEQAIRIVTDLHGKVIGLNALGLRLDQSTCEKWIKTALPIEKAINQLERINFNPEFSMKLSQQVNLELVS